jgi:DNA-binding GntR family transcriptional regulator
LQEACATGDARAAIRAEQDFYAVPFRHCSNPYLVEATRLIAPKILALRMHARRLDLSTADACQEAERFAAELQAGSVDAAAARLSARIAHIGAFLKAILLTSELGDGERSVGTSNVAFLMTFLHGESLLALAQDVCFFMI